MMWWAIWCAAVVASAGAAAAPVADAYAPLDLVQMDNPASDDEGISYAMPSTGGRFGAGSPWMYLFAEMPRDSQAHSGRVKKLSLSIDMPMAVLRNKLNQEKERREHDLRAAANRNFLENIGKRGFQWLPSEDIEKYY